MPARLLNRYSFLPLFLTIFFLSFRIAEACSCIFSPTVLYSFDHADVVVVVSAVSVERVQPEKTAAPGRMSKGRNSLHGVISTSMRVEQVFKGTVKVGDEMIFLQGNGADCFWAFDENDIGKKFLFYLTQPKNSNRWTAYTCSRSGTVKQAADDLLYLNKLDKVRNKTRVSGTLSFNNAAGESVAGRKIRLMGTEGTYETKTDENGVYEIYDLPAGRYLVEPEVTKGWKVRFWMNYSPSLDGIAVVGWLPKIPIILEAKKHVGLHIVFEIDGPTG